MILGNPFRTSMYSSAIAGFGNSLSLVKIFIEIEIWVVRTKDWRADLT